MGISPYLKEIGRGSAGARDLTREQAAGLMGQLLDGECTDLELGAFCIAMRVKGETPDEMAGFLDAIDARMAKLPASSRPVVVLPSYNGARKLPVLTPLLALLLARKGLPVLIHGHSTEDRRVSSQEVLASAGFKAQPATRSIATGQVHFVATDSLHPGLKRLLDVRRAIGLRNSAHSLVKLMNPIDGPALVVGSYTHPEYAESMTATFRLMGTHAMLLRGTEGEPVADPRRTPRMDIFLHGDTHAVQAAREGPLASLPTLPTQIDVASTAHYILAVMEGLLPLPEPIGIQADHIVRACKAIEAAGDPSCLQSLAASTP
ncbi:DNA-binding protein YbiB [Ottowia testudinis]|uniref:DNA-binding protein YbiB n=1 Tax=Ottowia testudinis TaxID=2816950 RepID=A0A975CJ88_9BURK|nr:DNA-binding protein YbiB [Ottowia testudinis]QTD46767.1 DNA-binding protein YbiB [Ottowia testudinis]